MLPALDVVSTSSWLLLLLPPTPHGFLPPQHTLLDSLAHLCFLDELHFKLSKWQTSERLETAIHFAISMDWLILSRGSDGVRKMPRLVFASTAFPEVWIGRLPLLEKPGRFPDPWITMSSQQLDILSYDSTCCVVKISRYLGSKHRVLHPTLCRLQPLPTKHHATVHLQQTQQKGCYMDPFCSVQDQDEPSTF